MPFFHTLNLRHTCFDRWVIDVEEKREDRRNCGYISLDHPVVHLESTCENVKHTIIYDCDLLGALVAVNFPKVWLSQIHVELPATITVECVVIPQCNRDRRFLCTAIKCHTAGRVIPKSRGVICRGLCTTCQESI